MKRGVNQNDDRKSKRERIGELLVSAYQYPPTQTTVVDLPNELITHLLSSFSNQEFLKLRLINKHFRDFNDEKLFLNLLNSAENQVDIMKLIQTPEERKQLFAEQQFEFDHIRRYINTSHFSKILTDAQEKWKDDSPISLFMRHLVLNNLNTHLLEQYCAKHKYHMQNAFDATRNGDDQLRVTRFPNKAFDNPVFIHKDYEGNIKNKWDDVNYLIIQNTVVTKLPAKMFSFNKLTHVDLFDNYLTALPKMPAKILLFSRDETIAYWSNGRYEVINATQTTTPKAVLYWQHKPILTYLTNDKDKATTKQKLS